MKYTILLSALISVMISALVGISISKTATPVLLNCPNQDLAHRIRNNPDTAEQLLSVCQETMATNLPDLSHDELYAVLAMNTVSQYAPYGINDAITLDQLYHASFLSCEGYAKLMIDLIQRKGTSLKVYYVVWEGGVYSAHVQVMLCSLTRCIIYDPTVAVFAIASMASMAMGNPIGGRDVHYFKTELPYQKSVINVLIYGRLNPSDLRTYVQVIP